MNNPRSTYSILASLREKTASLHRQLEASVDILNPAFELEDYKILLEKFYGFYLPVETQLNALKAYESLDLTPEVRRKAPKLVKDLAALGIDPARVPRCPDLPELNNIFQALGCMYVLEGATLGGQIIHRHLVKRPGWPSRDSFNFFNSYGNEVGPMWKSFCLGLERYVNLARLTHPPTAVETFMVEAANQTFRKLDAWLTGK